MKGERSLYIAGQRMTPSVAQQIAKPVTGVDFALKRVMPTWLLSGVIKLLKRFKPGKPDAVMPLWVAMQYGYCRQSPAETRPVTGWPPA